MIDAIKPGEGKPAPNTAPIDTVAAPGQVFAQQTPEQRPAWPESPAVPEPAVTSQPKPQQPYTSQPSNSYHQPQANEFTQPPSSAGYGSNSQQQPSQNQWQSDQWENAGEWPMMVSAEPKKSRRKTMVFLLILLILVGGGAAAYLKRDAIKNMIGMGRQQNTPPSRAGQQDPGRPGATGTESGNTAAVQTSSNVRTPVNSNASQTQTSQGQANPGSSQPGPGTTAQSQATSSASTPTQSTTPPLPGQKLFALQAASFPNESGAKQYSEKLVRAGVPAYVTSADIPRRGRWYRVRVGRFATPDEARKYASDWQQRARAAGMSIQLVTCDYTQP